jgi:lysozyme
MNYKRLIESIKHHEGFREKSYVDTLGYETIGYGFAIKNLKLDEDIAGIILERKMIFLILDCFNRFQWLNAQPTAVQEVIIEMCYQLGVTGVSKFVKTIDFIKNGDYILAGNEMLDSRWAKQTPNRARGMSEIIKGV